MDSRLRFEPRYQLYEYIGNHRDPFESNTYCLFYLTHLLRKFGCKNTKVFAKRGYGQPSELRKDPSHIFRCEFDYNNLKNLNILAELLNCPVIYQMTGGKYVIFIEERNLFEILQKKLNEAFRIAGLVPLVKPGQCSEFEYDPQFKSRKSQINNALSNVGLQVIPRHIRDYEWETLPIKIHEIDTFIFNTTPEVRQVNEDDDLESANRMDGRTRKSHRVQRPRRPARDRLLDESASRKEKTASIPLTVDVHNTGDDSDSSDAEDTKSADSPSARGRGPLHLTPVLGSHASSRSGSALFPEHKRKDRTDHSDDEDASDRDLGLSDHVDDSAATASARRGRHGLFDSLAPSSSPKIKILELNNNAQEVKQLKALQEHITQLRSEIDSCWSFLYLTSRKKFKLHYLQEIIAHKHLTGKPLRDCVVWANANVTGAENTSGYVEEKDKNFAKDEWRRCNYDYKVALSGYFSHRVKDCIDDILNSNTSPRDTPFLRRRG